MSLAVAALRLCTLKSLDGTTSAGARIFDSSIDPRDLLGDQALPTIVIYTDSGKRKVRGRDLMTADCHVDLVIELFVAKATKITVPHSPDAPDGQAIEVQYPATDAGYENRLRRLAYEIETILTGDAGEWPELWRRACVTFSTEHDSEWDRGADASSGGRFNFLRLIYRIVPQGDPVRGKALDAGGFWKAFFDLADTDDELKDLSKDWRALVTTPNLVAWRAEAATLGLTNCEAINTGIAPQAAPLDDTAELPALESITVDPIGTVVITGPMTELVQAPDDATNT